MSTEDKKVWYDHGLAFFFDNYYHLSSSMHHDKLNGELAKKVMDNVELPMVPSRYFLAKELSSSDGSKSNSMIKDQLGCKHTKDSFRPAQRRRVYNDSFQVSIPQ